MTGASRISDELKQALVRIARRRALLAFDFDGTLAPIVPRPEDASMRDSTRTLLKLLARYYPVAVITGRSSADVGPRLRDIPVKYVVGSHGAEMPGTPMTVHEPLARAHAELSALVTRLSGVVLEHKGASLAIHYRGAIDPPAAELALREALASLPNGVRAFAGKCVINIVPSDAPNKGEALLRLKLLERADAALFVGDDVTDEDAFVLDTGGAIVSLRVGAAPQTAARHTVANQDDVDDVLALLLAQREPAVD
jgi:trehalose 6-phosphate phosphatase